MRSLASQLDRGSGLGRSRSERDLRPAAAASTGARTLSSAGPPVRDVKSLAQLQEAAARGAAAWLDTADPQSLQKKDLVQSGVLFAEVLEEEITKLFNTQIQNTLLSPDEPRRIDAIVRRSLASVMQTFYKFMGNSLHHLNEELATSRKKDLKPLQQDQIRDVLVLVQAQQRAAKASQQQAAETTRVFHKVRASYYRDISYLRDRLNVAKNKLVQLAHKHDGYKDLEQDLAEIDEKVNFFEENAGEELQESPAILELREQLARLEAELIATKRREGDLRVERDQLKDEVDSMRKQIDAMRDVIARAEATTQAALDEADAAKERLRTSEDKLQKARDEIDKLQRELQDLKNRPKTPPPEPQIVEKIVEK